MCEVKGKERHGTIDTWRAKEDITGQHCFTALSSGKRVCCLWAHLLCAQIAWNCRFKQFWLKQVLLFLFYSWSIFTHRMLWEGLVKWQNCCFFHPPTPCLLFCKTSLPPWLIPTNTGCFAPIHYRGTLMADLNKSPWLVQKSESLAHMISLGSTHLNLHK